MNQEFVLKDRVQKLLNNYENEKLQKVDKSSVSEVSITANSLNGSLNTIFFK